MSGLGSQEHLLGHETTIEAGFAEAQRRATRFADHSWFAWQGYEHACRGREGAGHLAWERIALKHRTLRADRGSRIDDHKLAYALGFALGLTDQGRSSAAEASQLMGVVFPPARKRAPLYATTRFWLSVALVATFTFSQVGAVEFVEASYPVISEPLTWGQTAVRPPRQPVAPADVDADRALIEAAATGVMELRDSVTVVRGLPPHRAAHVADALLRRMDAPARVAVVDAVAHMPDDRIGVLIRRALADPDPSVVETALAATVSRGDRESLAAVQPLLRHASPHVRRVAVEALGALGGRDQASFLLPSLHDDSPEVQQAVRAALTVLVGRDLGPKLRPWRAHLGLN